MATALTNYERDQAADVVAQFSILIYSWQTNDFETAASVRAKLEHRGVRVTLPRRRLPKEPPK